MSLYSKERVKANRRDPDSEKQTVIHRDGIITGGNYEQKLPGRRLCEQERLVRLGESKIPGGVSSRPAPGSLWQCNDDRSHLPLLTVAENSSCGMETGVLPSPGFQRHITSLSSVRLNMLRRRQLGRRGCEMPIRRFAIRSVQHRPIQCGRLRGSRSIAVPPRRSAWRAPQRRPRGIVPVPPARWSFRQSSASRRPGGCISHRFSFFLQARPELVGTTR